MVVDLTDEKVVHGEDTNWVHQEAAEGPWKFDPATQKYVDDFTYLVIGTLKIKLTAEQEEAVRFFFENT